jgi:hypothetical protein
MSDERQKKNMKDGGMAADKLMEALAMPENREAAKRHYNTPAGYARKRPLSDDEAVAQFQQTGDDADIAQLQNFSDEHDADTTSAADVKNARVRALTASMNERDRESERIIDETPWQNLTGQPTRPVRLADGSYMMPTRTFGGADEVQAQQLMAPIAMPTRRGTVQLAPDAITAKAPSRYTEAERVMANERLGIRRAIDPRAAAYVAREMPRQPEDTSDEDYGAAPGASEELANFFNQRAAEFEAKARKPSADKNAEVVASFDDYAAQAALEATKPKTFDYKARVDDPGRKLGVTAQDMASSPLTAQMVTATPRGLALDPAKATGPLLAIAGQLGKRVKRLEARK